MREPASKIARRSQQAEPVIALDRGAVTAAGLYLLTGSAWVTLIGTTAWAITAGWEMWLRHALTIHERENDCPLNLPGIHRACPIPWRNRNVGQDGMRRNSDQGPLSFGRITLDVRVITARFPGRYVEMITRVGCVNLFGSDPHFVMITGPGQLTRSTRLRSRGKAARP